MLHSSDIFFLEFYIIMLLEFLANSFFRRVSEFLSCFLSFKVLLYYSRIIIRSSQFLIISESFLIVRDPRMTFFYPLLEGYIQIHQNRFLFPFFFAKNRQLDTTKIAERNSKHSGRYSRFYYRDRGPSSRSLHHNRLCTIALKVSANKYLRV